MTIKEAQATVDRWIGTTGIRYFNELTNMAILTEEVRGCKDHCSPVWRTILQGVR